MNVIDVNPNGHSLPVLTNILNDRLYFFAYDDVNKTEVWSTDGTIAGTRILKDSLHVKINASYLYQNVSIIFNDKMIFNFNDRNFDNEPYITDGTAEGTYMLKNIRASNSGSNPQLYTYFQGKVYFVANDGNQGSELWVTDGTLSGTLLIKDINPGSTGSDINNLYVYNDKLYFTANNGQNGRELWVTDGTTNGTIMLKDIWSTDNSYPNSFVELNGILYFKASDQENNNALYKTDGTENGTTIVFPFGQSPNFSLGIKWDLFKFNNKLFFNASDGSTGYELWCSDGTSNGTFLVRDLNIGSENGNPKNFVEHHGKLYFTITNADNTESLCRTDGTFENTERLNLQYPQANSKHIYLGKYADRLVYKIGELGNWSKLALYTESTNDLTIIEPPISTEIDPLSHTNNIFELNGKLFFSANFNSLGYELWYLEADDLNTESFKKTIEFNVYPNPSSGDLTLSNIMEGSSIAIIDILGNVIYETKANSSLEIIDISKFNAGNYFVKVSDKNGFQGIRKIVLYTN